MYFLNRGKLHQNDVQKSGTVTTTTVNASMTVRFSASCTLLREFSTKKFNYQKNLRLQIRKTSDRIVIDGFKTRNGILYVIFFSKKNNTCYTTNFLKYSPYFSLSTKMFNFLGYLSKKYFSFFRKNFSYCGTIKKNLKEVSKFDKNPENFPIAV